MYILVCIYASHVFFIVISWIMKLTGPQNSLPVVSMLLTLLPVGLQLAISLHQLYLTYLLTYLLTELRSS
jgi:energy-converting hydrogenase Eha subunit E